MPRLRAPARVSERVRIMCVSDYNQDTVLLVDVGGTLVINLNDAHPKGWGSFVRRVASHFDKRFLVALTGDASLPASERAACSHDEIPFHHRLGGKQSDVHPRQGARRHGPECGGFRDS